MYKHKHSRRTLLDSINEDRNIEIVNVMTKSEPKTLEDVKNLLELEEQELDHLDMPEHLAIQWSIPQHRWNRAK